MTHLKVLYENVGTSSFEIVKENLQQYFFCHVDGVKGEGILFAPYFDWCCFSGCPSKPLPFSSIHLRQPPSQRSLVDIKVIHFQDYDYPRPFQEENGNNLLHGGDTNNRMGLDCTICGAHI